MTSTNPAIPAMTCFWCDGPLFEASGSVAKLICADCAWGIALDDPLVVSWNDAPSARSAADSEAAAEAVKLVPGMPEVDLRRTTPADRRDLRVSG